MVDKCDGCNHQRKSLDFVGYCYMFDEEPETLPCGQHDKYKEVRQATAALIAKHPFMVHLLVLEALTGTKRQSWTTPLTHLTEVMSKSPDKAERCPALLFHGRGHQSRTKCQRPKGHQGQHYAIYGNGEEEAYWSKPSQCTGYFGQSPEHDKGDG